ncbi:MAG: helix-turn-helix transcriptional regulator [Clostridia bacterium]|nr:helix-turn-helix transcriptional regulator [Clostridia bacterium]
MFNSIELRQLGRRTVDQSWHCIAHPDFQPTYFFGKNRFHYVHSGSPTVYCDEKPYVLQPGKLYFFPQNLSFRAEMASDMQYDHTAIDFIAFPPTNMSAPIEIDLDAFPFLRSAFKILAEMAETVPMESYQHKNEYTSVAESYILSFVQLLNRFFPIDIVSDSFILDVLDYIHQNYDRELTLEELAERSGYQRQFFIRKFKKFMQVTPYKYIKDYRMDTAFYLLQQKKCSVTDVAGKVGYTDIPGFSRAFKQHFGITPREVANTLLS